MAPCQMNPQKRSHLNTYCLNISVFIKGSTQFGKWQSRFYAPDEIEQFHLSKLLHSSRMHIKIRAQVQLTLSYL